MAHQFLPNSAENIRKKMLEALNLQSVEQLFDDIPAEVVARQVPQIPTRRSEQEVERIVEASLRTNAVPPDFLCFLGGGIGPHYVPPVVEQVLGRSEFLTAYTPYQPEISQGMLQALFEFQSLICDLTAMDVANSSMYDWPTAAAEAVRMAARVTHRKRILVAESSGPERVDVIHTYAEPAGLVVDRVPFDPRRGWTDRAVVEARLGTDVAALYIEQPNFFGVLEEGVVGVSEAVHRSGALLIVGADPSSLGVVKPPGEYGSDVTVGDGQSLGLPMSYGGPTVGFYAVRDDPRLVRQTPGRVIGLTREQRGTRRGFAMVLQTREQHIRREAATSNICTNEALLAVAAAACLALQGPVGVRERSRLMLRLSHYAARRLSEIRGLKVPHFEGAYFREFAASWQAPDLSCHQLFRALAHHRILGGLPLDRYFSQLQRTALFSFTELHTPEDIDRLQTAVAAAMEG